MGVWGAPGPAGAAGPWAHSGSEWEAGRMLRVREAGAEYGSATTPGVPIIAAPELDSLLELEDEIRALSIQIHVATHRLLVVLAEFDRRRGWGVGGHRCCADWLSFHTGIDRGAARERVRAARALVELPAIEAAVAEGRLSFSQVRALTRVATPEDEEELLPLALENSFRRSWGCS